MLGFLLGGLWLVALRLWLQAHLFLNADTLSVPEIWATLKAGGRLGDWSMGNHAFIFPDLLLYQIAAWLTPGVAERQVAYGLVLGFLVWWVGAGLAAELFYLKRSQARAYVAAGLAMGLPFLKEESGLGQWFFPSHHGGAFLASLALSLWVLRQRQRPSGPAGVLWAGLLCGLVHASDGVFATWALLPALCLSLPQSWAMKARLAAVIVLSFLFKFLFITGLKAQGMKLLHFEWGYFLAHAHDLLSQAALQSSGFAASYAIPLGLAALFAGCLLWRWRSEPSPAALGLAWFGLLAVAVILASLQGQLSGRYLTWCLWVPAMLGPAWVASRWPALGRWALILPAGLAFFWVTLFSPPIPADQPEQRQAAWLDTQLTQRGVHLGWSDYWHSRPLRLFSRQGAQLVPVITDWGGLQAFEWVSYRPFFAVDPELKHPQFVVLNGLDPAKVVDRLKRKGEEVQGEGLTVWFYQPPAHTELR
jgi:hypothetical protein